MEPSLIAVIAILASAAQVAILRIIDYYFPRGSTRIGDRIAENRAKQDPNYHYDPDEDEDTK
jgi:hypothetical protein